MLFSKQWSNKAFRLCPCLLCILFGKTQYVTTKLIESGRVNIHNTSRNCYLSCFQIFATWCCQSSKHENLSHVIFVRILLLFWYSAKKEGEAQPSHSQSNWFNVVFCSKLIWISRTFCVSADKNTTILWITIAIM